MGEALIHGVVGEAEDGPDAGFGGGFGREQGVPPAVVEELRDPGEEAHDEADGEETVQGLDLVVDVVPGGDEAGEFRHGDVHDDVPAEVLHPGGEVEGYSNLCLELGEEFEDVAVDFLFGFQNVGQGVGAGDLGLFDAVVFGFEVCAVVGYCGVHFEGFPVAGFVPGEVIVEGVG